MPYFPTKFPHRPSLLVLHKFSPLSVAFSSFGMNRQSSHSKEEILFFLCCFSSASLKWPQENVKYLVLYIPWHFLEMIKMSLGLLLNILMDGLDRFILVA